MAQQAVNSPENSSITPQSDHMPQTMFMPGAPSRSSNSRPVLLSPRSRRRSAALQQSSTPKRVSSGIPMRIPRVTNVDQQRVDETLFETNCKFETLSLDESPTKKRKLASGFAQQQKNQTPPCSPLAQKYSNAQLRMPSNKVTALHNNDDHNNNKNNEDSHMANVFGDPIKINDGYTKSSPVKRPLEIRLAPSPNLPVPTRILRSKESIGTFRSQLAISSPPPTRTASQPILQQHSTSPTSFPRRSGIPIIRRAVSAATPTAAPPETRQTKSHSHTITSDWGMASRTRIPRRSSALDLNRTSNTHHAKSSLMRSVVDKG